MLHFKEEKKMASLKVFGGNGTEEGKFRYPNGMAVSNKGEIAVIDTCNHRVQLFKSDGQSVFFPNCQQGACHLSISASFGQEEVIMLS